MLNYDIETEEASKFWASRHRSNRMKAVIAFSLDKDNAMDNLRREGFTYGVRRAALLAYGQYINHPSMLHIPFTEMSSDWREYE